MKPLFIWLLAAISLYAQTPVTGPLTNSELRSSPVNVRATFPFPPHIVIDNYAQFPSSSSGLTDTQLRATPVPVSGSLTVGGTITISNASIAVTQGGSWATSVTNFPATQAVTGTFWQATQPVSIASMPITPVTGTFWQATQPVSGVFFQATQPVSIASMPTTPVTGTFFQSTQPVSIASMPSTPVTGTFFQATQPVSIASNTPDVTDRVGRLLGHVTVDNSSFAVTGTFFQATQPVSIASMPSTPVTGTFFQATQPVSLASVPSHAVTNAGTFATQATLAAETTKVIGTVNISAGQTIAATGTFWQSTQPVSIASMPSTPVTGTFWQSTQPVSLSIVPLPTGASTLAEQQTQTTSLQLIDDAVYADDAARSKSLLLAGVLDDVSTVAITENNAGYLRMSSRRALLVEGVASGTAFPVTGTFWQVTQPVSGTFFQSTQPVSLTTLPALTASSAVIGHVIADTGSTTAVTGTVTANATLSAETTKVIGTVNVAAAQTIATTNAGTFAVQAAQSGTYTVQPGNTANTTAWKVDNTAAIALNTGTRSATTQRVTIATDDTVALTANQSMNVSQINGVAPLMGNGITGTGSPRVTIASDNTPFSIKETDQTAVTNSPIGNVSLGTSLGKTNVLKTGVLVTTATTADQVILTYTVTAGKTLYVLCYDLSMSLTVAAVTPVSGNVSLESPAATKLDTNRLASVGGMTMMAQQYSEPIPIAAGTVIRFVCTPTIVTSTTWAVSFAGYEK